MKLLWLEPWDGTQSLSIAELHPLVIEICRRVRLEAAPRGGLRARGTSTAAARVAAKDLKGVTGDPWAPVETGGKDGAKVLSITGDGFGWRRMKELLVPGSGEERSFDRPLLARPEPEDGDAVEILAAALARGKGKTEGFHTRRVPVANRAAIRALAEEGEERQRLNALAQGLTGAAMSAVPPPTRGWTLSPSPRLSGRRGAPAHAGMDPPLPAPRTRRARCPRPRGDGPCPSPNPRRRSRVPPPTRGWTPLREARRGRRGGAPAHAGMDPPRPTCRACSGWCPRPRGDGPLMASVSRCEDEVPPPTRGWTRVFTHSSRRKPGAPAHAGMDP